MYARRGFRNDATAFAGAGTISGSVRIPAPHVLTDFGENCPTVLPESAALLSNPGRCRSVAENVEFEGVWVEGIRYLVCRNPEQARRNAIRREAVLDRPLARLDRSGGGSLRSGRGRSGCSHRQAPPL